jgi:hypothetical protein
VGAAENEIGDPSDKSTMKMRNSSEVPGARGERTCQEAVGVVDEVGDNQVDDPLRKLRATFL